MLPQNIITLVNSLSLASLPYPVSSKEGYEYHARFLPSGPDVAVEMTSTITRLYVDGIVCTDDNAFTAFIERHESRLARAFRELKQGPGDAVVFTGRWHAPEYLEGYFEAFVIHVIAANRETHTRRYDLEIFDNDYHQKAMTFVAKREITANTLRVLQANTRKLVSPMKVELTPYYVPRTDGIAWLSDNEHAPAIFCNTEWPAGLDKSYLHETLKIEPSIEPNFLVEKVEGPVSLTALMKAARLPVYRTQLLLVDVEREETQVVAYDPIECRRSATILFRESGVEGILFASEWEDCGDEMFFRIVV